MPPLARGLARSAARAQRTQMSCTALTTGAALAAPAQRGAGRDTFARSRRRRAFSISVCGSPPQGAAWSLSACGPRRCPNRRQPCSRRLALAADETTSLASVEAPKRRRSRLLEAIIEAADRCSAEGCLVLYDVTPPVLGGTASPDTADGLLRTAASEARLTSFIAIAKGGRAGSHWFVSGSPDAVAALG